MVRIVSIGCLGVDCRSVGSLDEADGCHFDDDSLTPDEIEVRNNYRSFIRRIRVEKEAKTPNLVGRKITRRKE
jgi:hypothetical protein